MAKAASATRRKKRHSLWPRRIITGAGLLGIIALIVWGVVALVQMVISHEPEADAAQSAPPPVETVQSGDSVIELREDEKISKDGIVSPTQGVVVPTCSPDALDITFNVASTPVGSGQKIAFTVRNASNVACKTAAGAFGLRIVTGEETMYDSHACAGNDPEATPLLLTPEMTWSGTLGWDGHGYVDGCTSPSEVRVSDAGTYRAIITLNGQAATPEAVFEVLP